MSPKSKTRRSSKGPTPPKLSKQSQKKSSDNKAAASSGRYTPPIPRKFKKSDPRMLYLIFGLLGLGVLLILLNYLDLLPGGVSSWYLLVGLVLISGGFFVATGYR